MKQLYKILLALSIVTATVATIDCTFGLVIGRLLYSSRQTKFSYAIHSLENPSLVIFGSSRAENHYDTPFIRDSLDIDAFNFGEPGRGLTYHDAAIRVYLQRHSPKVILLDLLADDLSGQINNRVKPLYPYIDIFPEIKTVAYATDPHNKYLLKSHLLRYNSDIFDQAKKLRHPYNPKSKGYTPLRRTSSYNDLEEKEYNTREYVVDDIAKRSLIDIIEVCKLHGVKLIVVYSPEYAKRNYQIPITTICDSLGVQVINDLDFRLNMPASEYFYDNRHLNKFGAREYTRHIINKLKRDSIL